MPALSSFDYAVLRIVPRVDRGEFVNAGVVLFCLERKFLRARVTVNEARLLALWQDIDLDCVKRHVEAYCRICDGRPDAGPIAALSIRQRFHWLVSPRSTVIQISDVHSGLTEDPEVSLERLFQSLVDG